jgi:hypothetical protein
MKMIIMQVIAIVIMIAVIRVDLMVTLQGSMVQFIRAIIAVPIIFQTMMRTAITGTVTMKTLNMVHQVLTGTERTPPMITIPVVITEVKKKEVSGILQETRMNMEGEKAGEVIT